MWYVKRRVSGGGGMIGGLLLSGVFLHYIGGWYLVIGALALILILVEVDG